MNPANSIFAVIPSSAGEWIIYLVFLLTLLGLFIVGQLTFGRKTGGKRAVMCAAGIILVAVAIAGVLAINREAHSLGSFSVIFLGIVLSGSGILGFCLVGVAIFGSQQKVDEYFAYLLRGL